MRTEEHIARLLSSAAVVILVTTWCLCIPSTNARASAINNPIGTGFVSASGGLPGSPTSQHSVRFGDINNDNKLDIATAGYSGVRVWTGDGSGNWNLASTNLPNSAYDGGVALGDINNDNNLDIAVTNYNFGVGGVAVWTGDGAGSWSPASSGLPADKWSTGIFLADINNDGNMDLAFASETPGGVRVFAGNGAGVWTEASTNLPTTGSFYGIWMGDVNNDNNMDLVAAGSGVHLWLGDGAGVWTEASYGLPWTDQWNGVTMGDINLDGNIDIVASMDMTGHGLHAWLGDGTSNWTDASSGLPTNGLYYDVILADLVGDRYPDILAAGYSGEGIRIWKGDGGSTWVDASNSLPSGQVLGLDAGDIDNDGYLDIAAVGENFGVQVWRNDAVTPPLSVEVEIPNGGETWVVGSQETVRWTASGGNPPLTVRIEYSTTGILGQYILVADGEQDDGSFLWEIPNTPSSDCFLRINVTDSTLQTNWDKSNSSFALVQKDTEPPTISSLQPLNGSTLSDSTPIIGASYNDTSGIDVGSVILMVDFINVTTSAMVVETEVRYIPTSPLSEGNHSVRLEVRDSSVSKNKAIRTWWFLVDMTEPSVHSLRPGNHSTINEKLPSIAANYSDRSGIDTASIVLRVDSTDVTSSASISEEGIAYTPGIPLTEGIHNVYLEVSDISAPQNRALRVWDFAVDTVPPAIRNLVPANQSRIGDSTPTIGADYSDATEVDMSSVALRVDSVNVTASSIVTPAGITYTPAVPLSDGVHNVQLELMDISAPPNSAVRIWWFEVDSSILDIVPPTISDLKPWNESTISDNTPMIGANYTDASGIDPSSVILKVDGWDVTSSATVTSLGVRYSPLIPMSEGIHYVYLAVEDYSANKNRANRTWRFTVDTLVPWISGTQPENGSIVGDSFPAINASYGDASGIDTSKLVLKVDSAEVTSLSIVTQEKIVYTPTTPLAEGNHSVYLQIGDNAEPANVLVRIWWFSVDTTPPSIFNLQPSNGSIANNNKPEIVAGYSDSSGISILSVSFVLDLVNITGSAEITEYEVVFILLSPLSDGTHSVHLQVSDVAVPSNTRIVNWSFTIDSKPPTISHTPVSSTIARREVQIEATVLDEVCVDSVLLYYRKLGSQSYVQISMASGNNNKYVATIPAEDVLPGGVQYYIEANDTVGNIARLPSANWEISPYEIEVHELVEFPFLLLAIGLVLPAMIAIIVLFLITKRRRNQGKKPNGGTSKEGLDHSPKE